MAPHALAGVQAVSWGADACRAPRPWRLFATPASITGCGKRGRRVISIHENMHCSNIIACRASSDVRKLPALHSFQAFSAACKLVGISFSGQPTMIEFKGSHFERDVILWAVRWYVAYPISYRQLEEMMDERGVEVDHSTLNRWVLKYVPLLEAQFRARKRPVGSRWRLDET